MSVHTPLPSAFLADPRLRFPPNYLVTSVLARDSGLFLFPPGLLGLCGFRRAGLAVLVHRDLLPSPGLLGLCGFRPAGAATTVHRDLFLSPGLLGLYGFRPAGIDPRCSQLLPMVHGIWIPLSGEESYRD